MQSILNIFKIGRGPSSSHSMAPERAAQRFSSLYPAAHHFEVTLYGSLSKTGKGHGTDRALIDALLPKACTVLFDNETVDLPHENTMDFRAYDEAGALLGSLRVLSIGGGEIAMVGESITEPEHIYAENTFSEIASIVKHRNIRLSDYVLEHEGPELYPHLDEVWKTMKRSIENGLSTSGILPGGLEVERKAQYLYQQRHIDESPSTRENRLVCAYAFAVSEENAGGGTIVTAPTCGSAGVLPAVLYYMQRQRGFSDQDVLRALSVAGLIGALIQQNASLSGAACGCQAEIGSACSMAAAALGELFEMGVDQIEYAAEVSLEHHLGLTCDPIGGLVQIPCIERNAVAAMRALNALSLANFLTKSRKLTFDIVVKTMYETGRDLHARYRETSEGGLAKNYN